jgi:hypothetical protein
MKLRRKHRKNINDTPPIHPRNQLRIMPNQPDPIACAANTKRISADPWPEGCRFCGHTSCTPWGPCDACRFEIRLRALEQHHTGPTTSPTARRYGA